MDIVELQQLTYLVLAVGFIFICYIITKIITVIRKYNIPGAYYGYLIITLLPFFELIKIVIKQPTWYGKLWFYSPFLYFWLSLSAFFLFRFFQERKR